MQRARYGLRHPWEPTLGLPGAAKGGALLYILFLRGWLLSLERGESLQ